MMTPPAPARKSIRLLLLAAPVNRTSRIVMVPPAVASNLPPAREATNSRSSASWMDRFKSLVPAARVVNSARCTSVMTLILPAELITKVSAPTR